MFLLGVFNRTLSMYVGCEFLQKYAHAWIQGWVIFQKKNSAILVFDGHF